MIPTKQTVLHDPDTGNHGNCLSAVLASLLHLPIEKVPVFSNPDTWLKDLNAWLRQYGLAYLMLTDLDCHCGTYGIEGLWHEVSGNTVRSNDVTHACVGKDGGMVFDPHPDGTGLTRIDLHGIFISLQPWDVAALKVCGSGSVVQTAARVLNIELIRENEALKTRLNALLYAVEQKFPHESRYETALRYIRQAEEHSMRNSQTQESRND